MRFAHIADLHLGKVIAGFNLLSIQEGLLNELLQQLSEKNIKTLVIAGDVYDRLVPSQEAVNVLDDFLTSAINDYHMTILMISGNHDSSDRLNFSSQILKKQGLYIETYVEDKMKYVEIDDCRFYLFPFAKPSAFKMLDDLTPTSSYQEAIHYYMDKQSVDHKYKNILITHHFVGGSSSTSSSELPLTVGGSEILDAHLFDDYDYVALGHLHASQSVSRDTQRYAGSLMVYSFDEVKQKKTVPIINTDDFSIEYLSLHPSLTLNVIEGTYEQFNDLDYVINKDNIYCFKILDDRIIPHGAETLKQIYPHLLQVTYPALNKESDTYNYQRMEDLKEKDILTLYKDFYNSVTDLEMKDDEIKVMQELIEEVEVNETN